MENIVNIFCLVAKIGAGKNKYLNMLLNDTKFLNKADLSLLVYGTTRKPKYGEKNGINYYFVSEEEYNKIDPNELIDYRSYYTIDEGLVYYFTKEEYMKDKHNVICITSPYQFASYDQWCKNENIRNNNKYKLNLILIDADMKTRMSRSIEKVTNEQLLYELCRRILSERSEFDSVCERIPEFIDPGSFKNVCYIDNNSNNYIDIKTNINKIKKFILSRVKND